MGKQSSKTEIGMVMEKTRGYLKVAIVLFLLGPYILLFFHFGKISLPAHQEFLWVFKNTLLQSFLSAFLSLVFGFYGALGLLYLRRKFPQRSHWIEPLALLPTVLPVLFVLLSLLNIISNFPFGVWGIVIIHSVVNVGLVSVMIARLLDQSLGGMAELAWIEGANRWQFLWQGVRGYLSRDIFLIFFFVFSVCFSSFAVPLIVGGEKGVTLEVLIYEKIRISSDWAGAMGLSVIQTAFMVLISFGAGLSVKSHRRRQTQLRVIESKWSWLLPYGLTFLIIFGLFPGFFDGLGQFLDQLAIRQAVFKGALGSIVMGLGTGFSLLGLFFAVALVCPSRFLEIFMRGFIAPSSVLTGFALLLMPGDGVGVHFLKMILGLCMVLLPTLYRLYWESVVAGVRGQVQVARTLGASWYLILNDLMIPQLAPAACFLAGFGAFWASGDFALSNIVADGDYTLALVMKNLIFHYRLDMAVFLSWILLLLGFGLFFFFVGIGRVLSRKAL